MNGKLFILFFLLLISFCSVSKISPEKRQPASQEIVGDISHFDVSEFQSHNEGDLPTPQLFPRAILKTSNAFSSSEKTKKIVRDLFLSRLNNTYKLTHFQASVFSGHSSALIHIFLKTACFRI